MSVRITKILKEFNVGFQTVIETLEAKGIKLEDATPNTKIDEAHYDLLKEAFGADKSLRNAADELLQSRLRSKRQSEPEPKVSKEEQKPQAIEAPQPEPEPAPANEEIEEQIVEAEEEEVKPEPTVVETINEPSEPEQISVPEETSQIESETEEEPTIEPEIVSEPKEAMPSDEQDTGIEQVETETQTGPQPEPTASETEERASEQEQQKQPETHPEAEVAKDAEVTSQKSSPAKEETPAKEVLSKKEQRLRQLGTEEDGVFKLHAKPAPQGPKVLGTIDLSSINDATRPKKKSKAELKKERIAAATEKKKRQRINAQRVDINAAGRQAANQQQGGNQRQNGNNQQQSNKNAKKQKKNQQPVIKPEVSDEDVARQVRETLARLTGKTKASKGAKYRREKRDLVRQQHEEHLREEKAESKVLKLTEFVTANELATMMDVPVTKVIGTCMSIGIMVSINQRLDAETIDIVAEEFGFTTEYISAEVSEAVAEEADREEDLQPRAPIVTVMGHVDHGKTSLLDYIRKTNVIAGEAGGITQHIGAYNVTLDSGRHITFLDTPGHEAFTAMRARGAQATDIAIIIIASDDDIMPQTKEAINHAVAAGVPIVFAINKIDKPGANPDKIKEGLAQMNFLVEEWGGKYQSQDISAKKGIGVEELLEKVLLEADLLELKANPNRKATGTVIESSLDKGRGYVATVLVSNGTLHKGDIVLAGNNYGRVKALFNERGNRIDNIGPAMAATLLGFNGAPQAGDQFHVMETEQEAREIATKREQLAREQSLRTQKMLTLDEIGRRIKQGSYQEMNIIVKGDVDGSVEALSDSLIKLSTDKIAVNVIHKGVGQISENDVTLAAASQAVIIGFQVRPSAAARKQADRDGVDIRLYSVIYDSIEEVRQAMEGMLAPVIKEEVTATVEVRQVYHISKVGIVAGSYVIDGKVSRTDKARLIRDGIVIFTGSLLALKRFKDDVKEVTTNFECGISLAGCNDIKEGDMIETFKEIEVKQKL
ncbi:MAG: translation initiation factor IF-2 [Bacteroidaceae bacterium]|nr:translation initiation factor IF-2 [Bacteroidaceae bacterium]